MEREPLCPFCGAYSPRSCEMREEMNDVCPWEELDDEDRARLREEADDREQAYREGRL